MAYMSQERKEEIAANLKHALKGSGVKYSLSVRHHSTLVMKIQSSPLDFLGNYNACGLMRHRGAIAFREAEGYLTVNPYYYNEHFTGDVLNFLNIVMPIMNAGNHDRSDIQSDYFDVGWYVEIKIGDYNRPYQLAA